jgi:hypothetical protein
LAIIARPGNVGSNTAANHRDHRRAVAARADDRDQQILSLKGCAAPSEQPGE